MNPPNSKALELADALADDAHWAESESAEKFLNEAAAELRRLAAENEALRADAGRWRMQIALDEEILRQPKFRKMQKCLDAFNEAFWDKGLIREAAIDAAIKDAAWSGVTTYMLGVTPEEEAEWQRKSDELDSRKP